MTKNQVRVGLGVFVIKNGQFLLLQRKGAHGEGTWSVPGGHIEFGETFEDTAKREVEEETGITINNIRFAAVTNDYFKDEVKHYVTVWVLSDWAAGKVQNKEPEKCTGYGWYAFNQLPKPLFLPMQQLLTSPFITEIKQTIRP